MDSAFPAVNSPNPENARFEDALDKTEFVGADVVIATDLMLTVWV